MSDKIYWAEAVVDAITHEIRFKNGTPGFVELDGNIYIKFYIPKKLAKLDPHETVEDVVFGFDDDDDPESYTSLLARIGESDDHYLYSWNVPFSFFEKERWAYFAVRFKKIQNSKIVSQWTSKLKKVYVNPAFEGGNEALIYTYSDIIADMRSKLLRFEEYEQSGLYYYFTDDGEGNVVMHPNGGQIVEDSYKLQGLRRKIEFMTGAVRNNIIARKGYNAARVPVILARDLNLCGANYQVVFNRWSRNTLHTPYQTGQTGYTGGVCLTYKNGDVYGTQLIIVNASIQMFRRRMYHGVWQDTWTKIATVE